MKNMRLISTAAAILLMGAGAVSAQSMKADGSPAAAPATQQNAPAETVSPALKSGQHKVPETTGQATPAAPEADKKQMKSQTMDKAPATAATKDSSDSKGSANVKNNNIAAESGTSAASSSRKSTDVGKRSTTGQGAANEGVVDPAPVRHRHHRHYRNCLPNIFDHGNCWR